MSQESAQRYRYSPTGEGGVAVALAGCYREAGEEHSGSGSTPVEELPLVAALAKRRAARAEQRAQFAAARKAGLKRRHQQKLTKEDPK